MINYKFQNIKMKKIILLIGLLIFSSCSVKSQKNDLESLNLKGNVKSVKETTYEAIEEFSEIIKGKRKAIVLGVPLDSYITFNSDGNIIENNKFYSDGSLGFRETFKYDGNTTEKTYLNTSRGEIRKELSVYDDKRNLVERKDISENKVINVYKYKYNYDNQGNITHIYIEEGNLFENYKYNSKGKLLEMLRFSPSGHIITKFTCKYYENGNLLETEELSYSDDSVIYSQKTEKYGINGKISMYIQTYKGILDYKIKYRYNEKGSIVERLEYKLDLENGSNEEFLDINEKYIYDSSNNLIKKMTTYNDSSNSTEKFKYDKNGNWVEKILFSNNTPEYIVERHIVYYK